MRGKPGRLFCFGMPKCGTTTVAALLNAHPAICLHNQKEPGDFLRQPPNTSLSGYAQTADTRWLADFTTTYGLTDKRARFFAGLRQTGIDPADARYVLCLRDPADLCRSYLRHIAERRPINLATDLPAIRAEILSACDFCGAMETLKAEAGAATVFIVRFDDLADNDRQIQIAHSLYRWLGLESSSRVEVVWANAGGSVGRYPPLLDGLAVRVRQIDWVRRLSPKTRARLRGVLSRSPDPQKMAQEIVDETLAWLEVQPTVQASFALLIETATGPLSPD